MTTFTLRERLQRRWNAYALTIAIRVATMLDALRRKTTIKPIVPEPQRKIRIDKQWRMPLHRSGWGFALDALQPLDNLRGIQFDGCIDETFGWNRPRSIATKKIPYSESWIGFFHRPPNVPSWNQPDFSPELILGLDEWHKSIACCRGIFCLSHYLKDWLQERVSVPVHALVHPTEIPAITFDPDAFLSNPQKSVVHIGWSQRRIQSFFELDARPYEKILVAAALWKNIHADERRHTTCGPTIGTVRPLRHLTKRAYDTLLSNNVAFIHLYDSSANNAIIECIARNTPILVNPLPAVREYLGEGYPLYFETLDEAAEKLRSNDLILSAHHYLRSQPKERFSQESFRTSLMESAIYRNLPSAR